MSTLKLTHPGSTLTVETTPDLARPYLDQGWSEKSREPRKSRKTAVRASATSGKAAPTEKENTDGD